MTREELDFIGALNMYDEISNEAYKKIMCHCEEQETCEDCISRADAMTEIMMFAGNKKHDDGIYINVFDAIELMRKLPSFIPQKPKTEWIPVSRRLPEERQRVLCTVMELCDYPDCNEFGVPETFMCEGYHHSRSSTNGWYICRRPDLYVGGANVIAWMPLPEPYKESEE